MAKRFREARSKAESPGGIGLVLWTARLRHAGLETDREPGGGDEDHGAQGCEDGDAVSTPRAGDCACCTEPDGFGDVD